MQDIGRILKEERKARGLELGDIARRTCISLRYIKAMEEGRFSIIPKYFDKGYLKIYANLLHLDAKPLLALYEEQQQNKQTVDAANARYTHP